MSDYSTAPTDDVLGLFGGMLPTETCSACRDPIKRRKHRTYIRCTWREKRDVLCPACWHEICMWASRFALRQLALDV